MVAKIKQMEPSFASLRSALSCVTSLALGGVIACFSYAAHAEDVQKNSNVGIDPYYTGSLLSPSPAIPQAGILAFEPYVIYQRNPGSYGVDGGVTHSTNATSSLSTFTLIKYGITDNLTINVDPQTSINMDSMGFNSGSRIDDLPVEFEYLLTRQDKVTGKPSVTLNAGVQTPTGRYENLPSASDGQGSGTYRARAGITLQSLFFGQSLHPIRIRVYGNTLVPLGPTDVHGISTFGSGTGFNGTGYSGLSYGVGSSLEYSITQKLVFALDVFYNGALSSNVNGLVLNGNGTFTPFNARSGFSDVLQIAPAFEYSLGPRFGIIAGVNFSAEGHNTAQFIQPQIAFNYVFDTSKGLSTFLNPYTGN